MIRMETSYYALFVYQEETIRLSGSLDKTLQKKHDRYRE